VAEVILATLCLIGGGVCLLLTLLVLWAGALERAATGSSDGNSAIWFFILALAGIGGGIAIIIL
jgi:hypothetical protein